MLYIADQFRRSLILFLIVGGSLLLLLITGLIVARAIDELRYRRRQRVIAKCRPAIDALLLPDPPEDAVDRLRMFVRRHEDVIAQLLVAPARIATGSMVEQLRTAAQALGIIDCWVRDLGNRRWWVRAEAARALGVLKETSVTDALIATLDDDHEEVRAAGVEALGHIADPRTVPILVSKLSDQSRHQRVRVVEAVHRCGSEAVPALRAHERLHPGNRAIIAELLGVIADPSAIDDLVWWMEDSQSDVRAAAMQALGSIGLEPRTYNVALRALSTDTDAEVRAMAARALGRSGLRDAAPCLGEHLEDEWIVAAHCATALRGLGKAGAAALRTYADADGTAGDLARQILFEMGASDGVHEAVAV
jgi:hypothetical protein